MQLLLKQASKYSMFRQFKFENYFLLIQHKETVKRITYRRGDMAEWQTVLRWKQLM